MPNKAEFIEELAGRLQTDKKQAGMILDTVLDSIYGHVAKGEKVVLTGFGIFEKRDRAARMARNPRNRSFGPGEEDVGACVPSRCRVQGDHERCQEGGQVGCGEEGSASRP